MIQIRRKHTQILVFCLVIFASVLESFGSDGTLDTFFNAGVVWRGGDVFDFAFQPDGKIVAGGNFTVVNGRSYNCLARFNSDGTLDTSFEIGRGANTGGETVGCNGGVNAVAVQADGKILVGGNFSTFGTNDPNDFRSYLARLNPDGSLDTSFIGVVPGTGPSGEIDDIVIQPDGKILIASFNTTEYNGVPVGYFARVNADGSLDTVFNANFGTGFNASTSTIALQMDGKILVGGAFTSVSSTPSNYTARLNSDGTVDVSFSTNLGSSANNVVSSIAIQADSKIILAGAFDTFSGASANKIVRLDSVGTRDGSFVSPVSNDANLNSVVIAPGGKILAGGNEVMFGSGPNLRNAIARLNAADGSIDASFDLGNGTDGHITSMLMQGADLIVGGGFTKINGAVKLSLARVLPSGIVNADFEPVIGSPGKVNVIAVQPDNKILVGGDFYGANAAIRQRLTRLNPDGTTDSTFFPGQGEDDFDSEITAIAVEPNGKILIGGTFASYGGVANSGIARLNADGSLDGTFSATTLGVTSIVVQPDSKIVIGGLFNSVNGVLGHNHIARLNSNGTLDAAFTATGSNSCTCTVEALALQADGKILAGGSFNNFNGMTGINNLVRLNSIDGSVDSAFSSAGGTGFNSVVYDLDIQPTDGKILATGWFDTFNGISRAGIARLSAAGALDGTFVVGAGFNNVSPVDLALSPNGSMVVVGTFFQYQGVDRNHIVRIGPNGMIDLGFNAGLYDSASTVSFQSSGKVIAGGSFRTYGNAQGIARIGIVRLNSGRNTANFSAPFDFDGDGKTDLSVFRPNGATGSEWWYLKSSDGGNYATQFGNPTDKLVAADYTGDGKADIAYWTPSTGFWYILRSEDSSFYAFPFGGNGDIPAPADYDGDGKADAAVFRPSTAPSTATWYIQNSGGGTIIKPFGAAGDQPVAGDYDGDGKADIAVFRPNGTRGAEWWIQRSTAGLFVTQFGAATDNAVPGDYTGDGKTDVAYWLPSTGEWFVLRSEDSSYYSFPFGASTDIPVPGDYDGDGKTDAAVFRPSSATWFAQGSTLGTIIRHLGQAGDVPVPSEFVR